MPLLCLPKLIETSSMSQNCKGPAQLKLYSWVVGRASQGFLEDYTWLLALRFSGSQLNSPPLVEVGNFHLDFSWGNFFHLVKNLSDAVHSEENIYTHVYLHTYAHTLAHTIWTVSMLKTGRVSWHANWGPQEGLDQLESKGNLWTEFPLPEWLFP